MLAFTPSVTTCLLDIEVRRLDGSRSEVAVPYASGFLRAASGGRYSSVMVLEVVVLNLRPGESESFEAAFREAQTIIAAAPGYERHELRRCVELSDRYLLLVWWDSVESHTKGFRQSPNYQRWRELLHHFYDPFPVVEHYVPVLGTAA